MSDANLPCSVSTGCSLCPSLCTCIFHGGSDSTGIRTVLCNNPDMSEIPTSIPGDTVKLRVEKTGLRRLPSRPFSSLPSLLYLWVSYSEVVAMDTEALAGLTVLRDLRLDGNLLTAFPWEALRATPHLHVLSLRNNRLASVSSEAAHFLRNVTYLDLSSNKLTTLPSDLMDIWPPFSKVIGDPSQKVLLGLQDNPWFCDCRISKLLELARVPNIQLVLMDTYLVCSGPENLAGVAFQLVALSRCLKPAVVTSRAQLISLLGSNVLLRCDATGYPTPSLSWLRADGLPINTTVVQESPGNGIRWSIISLNAVLYKDAGEYRCKAKNVVGSSEASITLTVAGVISTNIPKAKPASHDETWTFSIPVTDPKSTATRPTGVGFTLSPGPSDRTAPSIRSQQEGLLESEVVGKVQERGAFRKPSQSGKNKKASSATFSTSRSYAVKNIRAVEETANSVTLLWSTDGAQDGALVSVVYSSYEDKEKQMVKTEVGKGKLVLMGLKPQMKYTVCLVTNGQPQKSPCISFSTRAANVGVSLGWMFAVAGAVACAVALSLSGLLLHRCLSSFCGSSAGSDDEDLSKDTYVNFETVSLKQRTLGSQVGELWTRQQTQESERMLLCSQSSTDSMLTFRSDFSRAEYPC
ncbi:leucine-rich repeat, immunoglobulin-like domain and transmembrane domain-containing protein 3 [Brienomyrus brachyistius]|uniref:leucine-rich repeat, immunoglobulin-like domain and transmembrane domain-containing protein 3 n=1 Tax=Brienomyrus brachyistius TaxID=42636 RepID=UPI0020B3DA73|nr:leucine-rich repeat, immunoglobulin-like domain and transmembrane domain-containing protein 3 [Brienomyrus brachyistius]XP_048855584.1 leucine-rich repeat, immunoglobulin-like domain and transmembrane domain-containing protein 3 [Brienomyrus brachyistius]